MEEKLRTLLFDSISPNHLTEVAALKQYIEAGCAYGEPLFLSLGETWEHAPAQLLAQLAHTPNYSHGYQLSMYGLPSFRQQLSNYIQADHRLSKATKKGKDYEVGVTWTGTRNAIYDFGRLLKDTYFMTEEAVFITAAPAWDYAGVLGPLGYQSIYLELLKSQMFIPSPTLYTQSKAKPRRALIIINAQHNPTAVNWSPETVRDGIRLALSKSYAILLDDAHYGIHDPSIQPTSALQILLEELRNYPAYNVPWLAVRSLGKQFSINGWGIGALTSTPKLLDILVTKYRAEHIYNYGGVFQYALGQWLSTSDPEAYLARRNSDISKQKGLLQKAFLEEFGYDTSGVFAGDCTSFMLIEVPPHFAKQKNGVKTFLTACIQYGIILTDAWPRPYDHLADGMKDIACIRVYTGASVSTIQMLIERLRQIGFHYTMTNFRA